MTYNYSGIFPAESADYGPYTPSLPPHARGADLRIAAGARQPRGCPIAAPDLRAMAASGVWSQVRQPAYVCRDGGEELSVILAYAIRTGTKRNLQALRAAEWRLLVSAAAALRTEGFQYALDNGAWSAYRTGAPWDERRFVVALRQLGAGADWTTIPDIVAGGHASLDLSLKWMRTVLNATPLALLAVQDGLTPDDVMPFLGARVGIFVGGSTAWKHDTIEQWGTVGRSVGCWVHVGRVNSIRHISHCVHAGITSFDGSSASRYAVNTPKLDHARRQLALFSSCAHKQLQPVERSFGPPADDVHFAGMPTGWSTKER